MQDTVAKGDEDAGEGVKSVGVVVVVVVVTSVECVVPVVGVDSPLVHQ